MAHFLFLFSLLASNGKQISQKLPNSHPMILYHSPHVWQSCLLSLVLLQNTTESPMNRTTSQIDKCIAFPGTFAYLVCVYTVSTIGNAIIIAVVRLNPEFHKGGMLPMYTLAICDLVFAQCATITFLLNMTWESYLNFTKENCALNTLLGTMISVFVVYHHAILALTRFIAVCYPTKYKTLLSTRNTAFSIIAVFVLLVVLIVPTFLLPSPWTSFMNPYYNPSMLVCIYSSDWQVVVYVCLVLYGPPFQIATYCYLRCLQVLKLKKHDGNSAIDKKQKRLAYIMLINYAFVNINCCIYPVGIYIKNENLSDCHLWKRYLSYSILNNSMISPIVYISLNKKIQQEAIKLFSINKFKFHHRNNIAPS